MWVASYGVMPQTYIRAVPDAGPTSSNRPSAESKARTWTGPPGASSRAKGPEVHACMAVTLSGDVDPPRRVAGSEGRPGDRRPLPAGPGQLAPAEQQVR